MSGAHLIAKALTAGGVQAAAEMDRFRAELDGYAELIVGPGQQPLGFMTRGEDAAFTERVAQTLTALDLPPEARSHHAELARWFEHRRAFFKLEWHADGPLAACYFRRRPSVDTVLLRLVRAGIAPVVRQRVMEVADVLEKSSIHFVAAAFRPNSPVHQKLYFSQWVTPATTTAVATRIASVFKLYGLSEAAERWRSHHRHMLPPGETTVFLSISFTAEALSPSFKIDYPGVGAVRAAGWLAPAQQLACIDEIEAARPQVGAPNLTYLGTRFQPGRVEPTLKYYFDVPSEPPIP